MATKFRAKHYLELRLPTRPFLLEKTSEIGTLYDSVLIDNAFHACECAHRRRELLRTSHTVNITAKIG